MNKETILPRILRIGAGLVLLMVIISTVVVIPCIALDKTPGATPERAIFGTTVVIILHLPFLLAFWAAIVAYKHGSRLKNIVYIASGIGLLVVGLMILDGAVAYSGHIETYFISTLMFICIGCDFSAAVMVFTARRLQPKKVEIK